MFITTHLSVSVLPGCEDLEMLSVVVRQESCKVCICLFYRPPNSLSFVLDSFQSYLESLAIHQYTNFIVLGDFNIDFFNPTTPLFSRLKSLCPLFSLTQIVKEPTHTHHDGSTSLINLVFMSNPILSNSCFVVPPLSNADHKGIQVQTSWKSTAKHKCDNHSKGRTIWCYSQADWERACDPINSVDWSSLLSDDINEAWSNWSQKFLSIMNECIPKKKLPNRKNLPWLTKKLITMIKRRNLLYKIAKLTGNFSKYRAMRNKVTSEL